jgi:hypothetical protein
MFLANYAESREGLLYVMGAGWDTLTVQAPLQGGPPGAVAVLTGALVIRLLVHPTETGQTHELDIHVIDEDGAEVARVQGQVQAPLVPGLPIGWDQGVNLVISLHGMPIPRFGQHAIAVRVSRQHLGDLRFRVLKGY